MRPQLQSGQKSLMSLEWPVSIKIPPFKRPDRQVSPESPLHVKTSTSKKQSSQMSPKSPVYTRKSVSRKQDKQRSPKSIVDNRAPQSEQQSRQVSPVQTKGPAQQYFPEASRRRNDAGTQTETHQPSDITKLQESNRAIRTEPDHPNDHGGNPCPDEIVSMGTGCMSATSGLCTCLGQITQSPGYKIAGSVFSMVGGTATVAYNGLKKVRIEREKLKNKKSKNLDPGSMVRRDMDNFVPGRYVVEH